MSFCLMFGSCNREWSGAYDNVIKKMMFVAMAENAYDQIQSELEKCQLKKIKRGKPVPLT